MSFSDNGIVPAAARTSETDPLYISELTYGNLTIGITMMPGRRGRSMTGPDWDRDLSADMAVINAWDAEHVVIFLTDHNGDPRHGAKSLRESPHAGIRTALRASVSVIFTGPVIHTGPAGNGDPIEDRADRVTAGRTRILLISERGLETTGTFAAIILRRAGVDAPDAIAMVNACRPDSITTIAQREIIAGISPRESVASYLKRESQPPGIIVAKYMAGLLEKSSGMSRCAALEAHAVADGWKNWSTMSAALSGPGLPYPGDDPGRVELHKALGLDSGSAEVVSERIIGICGLAHDPGLWKNRAATWVRTCIAGLFDLHARSGTTPSFETLKSSLHLDTPIGFIVMLRAYMIGGLSGPGKDAVIGFAKTFPGLSMACTNDGAWQNPKVHEQAGFLSMQISCELERIEFDLTGRTH